MAIADQANLRQASLRSALLFLAGLLLCAAALLSGGATKASAATCPNEALREGQVSAALPNGTTFLPNCMALELVSPAKKYNQYAKRPQFSATAERVQFASLAALADTPKLGFIFDPYVATRTTGGWQTEATASPPEMLIGTEIRATPCSYSPDLSHWAYWGSTASQGDVAITTPFHGGLGGFLAPLGPTMAPLTGSNQFAVGGGFCQGTSGDAKQLLFSFEDEFTYLPGEPIPLNGKNLGNIYKAFLDQGIPSLVLLQRDKNGDFHGGSCGGVVGGPRAGGIFPMQRAAVSPDGSRIYFTTNPGQPEGVTCDPVAHRERIMLRLETPSGPEISQLIANECDRVSPPCSTVNSPDAFLGASQEGTKVFFLTSRQLTDSDLDETQDLYLHDTTRDPGERLTQVSAGESTAPSPGAGAEVQGVSDFAGDGSRVYFGAKGILTTATNLAGESAQAGMPNLYLYEQNAAHPNGHTAFITTLSAEDETSLWGGSPGERNQAIAAPRFGANLEDLTVGGDGRTLVFASKKSITADDTDGGKLDVYRYDSQTGEIERVSSAAPGGSDNGPFDVTITTLYSPQPRAQNASFGRWASEDAGSVVFTTEEQLSPLDANDTENAYLWRNGEVVPLPSPAEPEASEPVVSMSGDSVAFVSSDPLLSIDGDSAKDVYVARANGGFPPPPPPLVCEGEACQGQPGPRPGVVPLSSEKQSSGNPKQKATCRRGFARRGGRCVKRASQKQRKHKRANRKQGGRK